MNTSTVGHIVRSRFLQASAGHYRRMVERLESSEQLIQWVENQQVIRYHYPFEEDESSHVVIATTTAEGFIFTSRYFALHYEVVDQSLESSALLYNLEHISRRNRQTHRLLTLLTIHQQAWVESGATEHLLHYPYKQVVGDYHQRWGGYMDMTIISRLVSGQRILLRHGASSGAVVPLKSLFPCRWMLLGERIRQLMEDREQIWTDQSLAEELSELEQPVSRRYVAHCRGRSGIAPGRGRRVKPMPGTPPICWGVPGPSMQSSCSGSPPAVGFMSSLPLNGGWSMSAPAITCASGCWTI